MSNTVFNDVRELLAGYVEVEAADFQMSADLAEEYAMDSTELTEIAKKIERRFGISVDKSERLDWTNGERIYRFPEACLSLPAACEATR